MKKQRLISYLNLEKLAKKIIMNYPKVRFYTANTIITDDYIYRTQMSPFTSTDFSELYNGFWIIRQNGTFIKEGKDEYWPVNEPMVIEINGSYYELSSPTQKLVSFIIYFSLNGLLTLEKNITEDFVEFMEEYFNQKNITRSYVVNVFKKLLDDKDIKNLQEDSILFLNSLITGENRKNIVMFRMEKYGITSIILENGTMIEVKQ